MINVILIFFVLLILTLVLVYNIINQNEKRALYYPSKRVVWKPKVNYKTVFLDVNSRDAIYSQKHRNIKKDYISGWHFNNFEGAKTIMFCHGNTGNITHRKYIIDICTKFKLNLFVFDVRGFGKSDGFPHKLFLREDGEIVYNYLHRTCGISHQDIIVWGESLGGVTAVHTASKYKCGGLILLCCFSSLDDAINYRFEGVKKTGVGFLTGLLSYKLDMVPVKHDLKKVRCPVVIIHSADDELVPYSCSWINYHSIKHKNKLHLKIKGGHASPDIEASQLQALFDFCQMPLDNLSENIDIAEILASLKTFAEKYGNFIDP